PAPWRAPRGRDMRVLGCPNGFEATLLECLGKFGGRHRIVGEEHRRAEMHQSFLRGGVAGTMAGRAEWNQPFTCRIRVAHLSRVGRTVSPFSGGRLTQARTTPASR